MLMSEHQQMKIKLLRLIVWSSAHSHNPPTKFCANPVGYSDVILLTSSQKPGRFPGLRAVFQTSHTTFHFCQLFGRRRVLIKMWFLSAWIPPIRFGGQTSFVAVKLGRMQVDLIIWGVNNSTSARLQCCQADRPHGQLPRSTSHVSAALIWQKRHLWRSREPCFNQHCILLNSFWADSSASAACSSTSVDINLCMHVHIHTCL